MDNVPIHPCSPDQLTPAVFAHLSDDKMSLYFILQPQLSLLYGLVQNMRVMMAWFP